MFVLYKSDATFCHPERSIAISPVNRTPQALSSRPEQIVPGGNDPRSGETRFWKLLMKDHCYSVYILASKSRVIYVGMTNNLHRRLFEHKNDQIEGFTRQYRCHRLVYYESFDDVNKAIDREKQLKRWNRAKKMWLIERLNPTWEDLAAEWFTRHMYAPEKQVPPLAG